MTNLSNSTATATATTLGGGTEGHSPSPLHVGAVFGIVIIVIVLIVTVLLLLCRTIKSTYPQMHSNWTAYPKQFCRHHTNEGRRKSRRVVDRGTEQNHQACASSRPDFQLVVREQRLCGPHNHNARNENQCSFALQKSGAPGDEYTSSLHETPPPSYSEVIQSANFTSQQTINDAGTNCYKPACSDHPPPPYPAWWVPNIEPTSLPQY